MRRLSLAGISAPPALRIPIHFGLVLGTTITPSISSLVPDFTSRHVPSVPLVESALSMTTYFWKERASGSFDHSASPPGARKFSSK